MEEGSGVVRILLVERDNFLLDAFRAFLRDEGHHVEAVSDCSDAVDLARVWRPDMVIVDVRTSDLGRELTLAFARDAVVRDIPVYVIAFEEGPAGEASSLLN